MFGRYDWTVLQPGILGREMPRNNYYAGLRSYLEFSSSSSGDNVTPAPSPTFMYEIGKRFCYIILGAIGSFILAPWFMGLQGLGARVL